MTCEVLYIV